MYASQDIRFHIQVVFFVVMIFAFHATTTALEVPSSPLTAKANMERTAYTIFRNDEEVDSFDLREALKCYGDKKWVVPNTEKEELLVSPDGRYFPVVYHPPDGGEKVGLVIYDYEEKIFRNRVFNEQNLGSPIYVSSPASECWLATSRFVLCFPSRSPGATTKIAYDLDSDQARVFTAEAAYAVSSSFDSFAGVYFEIAYFKWPGRHTPKEAPLLPGNMIHYNGYLVYPEAKKGRFRTLAEWLGAFSNSDKDVINPFQVPDYGLGKHYVFTGVTFVADTPWVAFVEQVYQHDKPDELLETNVVAVDASRVSTDPPRAEDIRVTKLPIAAIQPEGGYDAFRRDFDTVWNQDTGRLEVWRFMDKDVRDVPTSRAPSEAKIENAILMGEVTVKLDPFELIEFVPPAEPVPDSARAPSPRPW